MSGTGRRFAEAGYARPKPLIEVDGKPIIQHVVSLFPGETKFTFICREEHLAQFDMKSVLESVAPEGNILAIAGHKKGPVYAVSQIYDAIDDDEEVIVNYCDFAVYWDYNDFLFQTRRRNAAGCVPSYRGFHPHMLGSDNYAFIRDDRQRLLAIQEKKPFTDDRLQEYASTGTYYFREGRLLKRYFDELLESPEGALSDGEYYVSMVYNLLAKEGLYVYVYEVQHMLQWGTPRDLQDYQYWSNYFASVDRPASPFDAEPFDAPFGGLVSTLLVPMAGRGKRFADDGEDRFRLPKPFINVAGRPMVEQAIADAPKSDKVVLVTLDQHADMVASTNLGVGRQVVALAEVSQGQAATCAAALERLDQDALDSSVFILACDNGMTWDRRAFENLLDESKCDAVIFTFRGHPSVRRNASAYGWVQADADGRVERVSVKVPISDAPQEDPAIVGSFYLRRASDFLQAYRIMKDQDIRVNAEFYVDSLMGVLVEMGKDVRIFDINSYVCWGTPDDLRTYEYWQSFFHKCDWHPYELGKDAHVPADKVAQLERRYTSFYQPGADERSPTTDS